MHRGRLGDPDLEPVTARPPLRPRRPPRRARKPARQWPRDGFVVGGRRAVAEALRAGKAKRVLAVSGAHDTEGMKAVTEAARRGAIAIEWVGREAIDALGVADHQGVAAFVRPPEELDDGALAAFPFSEQALVVALDGIMDPQNLGACARSAEAAGAALLVVRERRAAPITPAAVRSSAGALLHLPLARVTNLTRTVEQLKDRGFFVVGLDHRADLSIDRASAPPRPLAVVIGGEGAGISRLVRESCDELVSIPMAGRVDSLNASAALAVALFGYALRPPTGERGGGK